MTRHGAITASSRAAAEAGSVILDTGGNAADAAVAAALASCVADGCNTGLGGYGGHAVIVPPNGAPVTIDFNMWVPHEQANAYQGCQFGWGAGASAIPNVVAGLARLLSEFGSLGWAEVSAPALTCAREGVEANATIAQAFAEVQGEPFLSECFAFEATGRGSPAHFQFRQPALAHTLENLAEKGPAWFYEGPIGDAACRILQEAGHELNRDDWAETPQAVRVEAPARFDVEGARILSSPLSTSGSACMFGTLAAGSAIAGEGKLESPEGLALWARQLASMWTYRFATQQGNDIFQDGLEDWIDRALSFSDDLTISEGEGHTCHLNAMDSEGMAIAMTLTHGPAWFGARWALPETGIIMNAGLHLLRDVAPCLRERRAYAVTNMSPTVARLKDGGEIAAGCPGARRIPSIIGTFLTRHVVAGLGIENAIAAGRFHAESRQRATLEAGRWSSAAARRLAADFAQVAEEGPADYFGPFTAIRREADGKIEVGLDDRSWEGFAAV